MGVSIMSLLSMSSKYRKEYCWLLSKLMKFVMKLATRKTSQIYGALSIFRALLAFLLAEEFFR